MTTPVEKLAQGWLDCGVAPGDMLLVHSALKRTLQTYKTQGMNIAPADVLDSFLLALGKDGTLLLPLFNFDFTKGVPFDIKSTPSHMGALSEAGRLHPKAIRTGHPIYSFAAIGAKSGLFEGLANFSGYGADSPFAILHREKGKIGILDLPDQNSMTFYHYVEEAAEVDYRYHKTFKAPYIDATGKQMERQFGLFVRDIEKGVLTHVDPMGEQLWEKGLYRGCRPGTGAGLRSIEATALYDFVMNVIGSGGAEGTLYRIETTNGN